MFGLSTWEIILIAAVALIFIGPDQLPKVAKQVGKGLRQMRGAVDKVDGEVRRAVREATAEAEADDDAPTPPPSNANVTNAAPAPNAKPTTPPPAAPTPGTRDWTEVGRTPVEGRVPTARPARPVAPPTGEAMNDSPPVPSAALPVSKKDDPAA